MRFFYVIALLLLSSSVEAQEMRIEMSETNKSFVDKYNAKAEAQTNTDSVYFYYNRAILIAQKINYFEGEERSYLGLVDLYKNDEKIYEKLRYSLLLVRLYEKKVLMLKKLMVMNH